MLLLCTIIYYFGELAGVFGWESPSLAFFYGVHDIQRLLFLAPIVYSGYTAGVRAAIIVSTLSLIIFLPRAFLVSTFPDPVIRPVLFTIIAGIIGVLTAVKSHSKQ
jgi:hypothetical protein